MDNESENRKFLYELGYDDGISGYTELTQWTSEEKQLIYHVGYEKGKAKLIQTIRFLRQVGRLNDYS